MKIRVCEVPRLADSPDTLACYRSLAPEYRKDRARCVNGTMREETRAKRRTGRKARFTA
ncbi:YdeI/OmpD-associated family protein [Paenibacillus frigoriresistens]|uniref:YdeI/OmpD-associated family protein n=1 Tax=Paenibacillus alginolyticus TaxID=59839 RepID=UPI001566CCC7|nr:YdeI/OmpD-associated family protein [Paenibacillus frigoriresistens]